MIRTDKGHFWLKFDNGYTISVFNGFGSYSENHYKSDLIGTPEFASIDSCDCEIAIIKDGIFLTNEILHNGDEVYGWVNANNLAKIIKKVSELEND